MISHISDISASLTYTFVFLKIYICETVIAFVQLKFLTDLLNVCAYHCQNKEQDFHFMGRQFCLPISRIFTVSFVLVSPAFPKTYLRVGDYIATDFGNLA